MSSVSLSVCPSVCVVDRWGCWKSWKLIAWTLRPTPSLFIAQRPSTYSKGNMGKFWGRLEVGWEKVTWWSTKAAISLKRVKIAEKLLWRAYRNSLNALSNGTIPTPTASPSPRLGFATQPKTAIAIFSGTGKATNCELHSQGPSEQKPMKHLGEKGAQAYPETAQIFWVPPYYLRNGQSYELQIWQVHSQGPSKQNPITNLGERGAWVYPGTNHIFDYLLLSEEWVKLQTSNFVRTLILSIGIKAH